MAISFRRYIDITSGVGAGVRVPGRELIGRIFSTSSLIPTDTIVEFTEAADVAAYFGSEAEEYKRAAFYFGWISKTQTRARKIGFVRHTPLAVAATLRGVTAVPPLADFQEITAGSFRLTLDGNTVNVTGINLASAVSYADVAALLEVAIRAAAVPSGTQEPDPDTPATASALWSAATVAFDARIRGFIFSAGEQRTCTILPAENNDPIYGIASLLRWTAAAGALASDGRNATSVTDTLNQSAGTDNNFGSFLFMADLTIDEMEEAARFAHLSNVGFMYCQRVHTANAAGVHDRLAGFDGVALTEYDPARSEYPEMAPMIMLAATDYTRRASTLNYMFHQFNLTPTVLDNGKADLLDKWRVNYYGRTQQAGQVIDFYQRGVLQGSISDMNVYANEMWLKDRIGSDIMTLKLALPKISANATGRIQIIGALRNVIDMALTNGTISIDKPLTYAQKAFITEITGDDMTWVQVQSQGYHLDAYMQETRNGDRVEYKAVYLLVYAKDDTIRKTEGTHSLI